MRILRVLAVATVSSVGLQLAWGALADGHQSMTLDSRAARVAKGDHIAIPYPAGWHATSSNGRDIVISSFPVSRRWFAARRRSMPKGGVLVWVFTYGRLPQADDAIFPPRPGRLQLDPKRFGFYECMLKLEGYQLTFSERRMAIQVEVALGRGADRSAALAVINRLRVA